MKSIRGLWALLVLASGPMAAVPVSAATIGADCRIEEAFILSAVVTHFEVNGPRRAHHILPSAIETGLEAVRRYQDSRLVFRAKTTGDPSHLEALEDPLHQALNKKPERRRALTTRDYEDWACSAADDVTLARLAADPWGEGTPPGLFAYLSMRRYLRQPNSATQHLVAVLGPRSPGERSAITCEELFAFDAGFKGSELPEDPAPALRAAAVACGPFHRAMACLSRLEQRLGKVWAEATTSGAPIHDGWRDAVGDESGAFRPTSGGASAFAIPGQDGREAVDHVLEGCAKP